MRKYVAGNGSDSSAAARAYKLANRASLRLPQLYVIRTAPQFTGYAMGKTFLLTDWPSPLVWSGLTGSASTFKPANISRGQIESRIGLEAQTVDVTWTPKVSDVLAVDGSNNTLLTALEGFSAGIFDNADVEIWEAVMLPGGDCETLGATCLFGGRIGAQDPDALKCKFTVTSRCEAFTTQIPTVTVEAAGITAQYLPGVVPDGAPSSLTVASGSTAALVLATAGGSTPAAGVYDGGYIEFTAGQLGGFTADILSAGPESGSPSTWAFVLERPLPFAPAAGDTLTGYLYAPAEPAFPYLPSPINTAMMTG
jgi:hypothetical protein